MSDKKYCIQILVHYTPNLDYYPADITTVLDALEMDVAQERDGLISPAELVDFAEEIEIRVIEVPQ